MPPSSSSSMPLPSSSITESASIVAPSEDDPHKKAQLSNFQDNRGAFFPWQWEMGRPVLYFLSDHKEFVCGGGSAFINILITFPINKLIFRQQLHGISGSKAVRQLRKDGLRHLYRGLLPPLLQKTTSISVMFGVYCRSHHALEELWPSLSRRTNIVLSGFIAGTLEATLAPFERVQTLMQTRKFHNRFTNTFSAFKSLWRRGPTEYYRGASVIILRNGPSNSFFFLGRDYLKVTDPNLPVSEKIVRDFVSGACLGALISTFFFPFNVMKTHMQAQLGGPFVNIWTTFKNVVAERDGNIRNLFKGVHLNYTRSLISWGIINSSYELLMKLFTKESDKKKY